MAKEATPVLADLAMNHYHIGVRQHAFRALGWLAYGQEDERISRYFNETCDDLIELLKQDTPAIVESAAFALGNFFTNGTLDTRDTHARVRTTSTNRHMYRVSLRRVEFLCDQHWQGV